MPEFLTLQQVADLLALPVKTLYMQRYRGTSFPAYKIGKHVRVRRDELDRWLEAHRDPAA